MAGSTEKKWDYLPTSKQEIIGVLDRTTRCIADEMRNNPQHSIHYYNALSSLLNKVVIEIFRRNIFDAPDGWYYSFEVSNKNARLFLKHIHDLVPCERNNQSGRGGYTVEFDECFSIINYPVKSLSVEEYANRVNTQPVTVRQWIRRGKLRNAFRLGGEWRIPSISDVPPRGYLPVTYYVNREYVPFPSKFLSVGTGINTLTITPHGRGTFDISADGRCLAIPPRLFSDNERIEIEQALMSNPNISNSLSVIGVWPEIKEVSLIRPVSRSGGMRLPDGWDKNLY